MISWQASSQGAVSPHVVWDVVTRALHWLLALAVVLNMFVLEEGDQAHRVVGFVAVGSVAVRSVWGFVAPGAARFSSFPLGPQALRLFLGSLLQKKHMTYPGHNPGAAVFAIALWTFVLALGVTGWMQTRDAFFGEEWLEELHEGFSNALGILLVLHLSGIALDAFVHRRKTWLGMVTGRRSSWGPSKGG